MNFAVAIVSDDPANRPAAEALAETGRNRPPRPGGGGPQATVAWTPSSVSIGDPGKPLSLAGDALCEDGKIILKEYKRPVDRTVADLRPRPVPERGRATRLSCGARWSRSADGARRRLC